MRGQFLLLLLVLILLLILNYKGITLSDEYLYSAQAVALNNGTFEWTASAFANRFGQIIPMAGIVAILGPAAGNMVLWSSLCLILLFSVFYFWMKATASVLLWPGILVLLLNPALLSWGADVSHDLTMAASSFAAIYLLWKRQFPILMVGFLAWAFLSKMAVLFIGPFYLWILWYDWKNKQYRPFWWKTIIAICCFALLYFGMYQVIKGDWLFRFRGIAGEHNISEWSYYQKNWKEIFQRITIGPAVFIAQSPGLSIPFLLASLWIFRFKSSQLDQLPNFLFAAIFSTLILFWLGTTSFQSYNPMLLTDRMWLIFIPLCTFLGVISLNQLLQESTVFEKRWFTIFGGLVFVGSILGLILYPERPFFSLTIYGVLLLAIGFIKKWPFKKIIIGLMIPLIGIQVYRGIQNRQNPFFEEKAFFHQLEQHPQLILADTLFCKMPWTHTGFVPDSNIHVQSWHSIQNTSLQAYQKAYILKNENRLEIEQHYFKLPMPSYIENLSGTTICTSKGLTIEEIEINTLRRALSN